jgi:hypothetical protein
VRVGIITLVEQIARKYFGLAVEPFWVVVGLYFVLGGVWELLGLHFSLVQIMLIVAGMALLFSAMRRQGAQVPEERSHGGARSWPACGRSILCLFRLLNTQAAFMANSSI